MTNRYRLNRYKLKAIDVAHSRVWGHQYTNVRGKEQATWWKTARYDLWSMWLVIYGWAEYHHKVVRILLTGHYEKLAPTHHIVERVLYRNKRAKLGIKSRMGFSALNTENVKCWGASHAITKDEFYREGKFSPIMLRLYEKERQWNLEMRVGLAMGVKVVDPKQGIRDILKNTTA